jgi:hypothetical protein
VAVAAVPLSPLHAVHVNEVVSHSGVAATQFVVLSGEHSRHRWAPTSQMPLRQSPSAAHGPLPVAFPHLLSVVSHVFDAQTTAAAASEHVPSSAGVCPAAVGIAVPFASVPLHTCGTAPVSHHWSAAQSASAKHCTV